MQSSSRNGNRRRPWIVALAMIALLGSLASVGLAVTGPGGGVGVAPPAASRFPGQHP